MAELKFTPPKKLKKSFSDISEFKILLQKNTEYTWEQFIIYNNLDQQKIIEYGDLDLLKYYYQKKQVYYQDISMNAKNITLETIKFVLSKGPVNMKSQIMDDFDYNLILSFVEINKPEILEYLYESEILPENFYINGIWHLLETAIENGAIESFKILLKYIPKYNIDFNILEELDPYKFALLSNLEIYKITMSKINKNLDDYWKEYISKGLRDTGIDKKEKISCRFV